jgi:hypothetical protein
MCATLDRHMWSTQVKIRECALYLRMALAGIGTWVIAALYGLMDHWCHGVGRDLTSY